MFKKFGMFFDEGAAGGASTGDAAAEGDPLTFESFLEKQPDNVKALLDGHTKGLKSALESERESRKGLEKQIRELAGKAEKGSDAEAKLTQLANDMETVDRKATFYEDAHGAGVSNLKLAFLVATSEGLFDKKGSVNFVDMKARFPELFLKPVPEGNAGEGSGEDIAAADMNTAIRRMSGRK